MKYRVRSNEEQFFDIAASSIPMYWLKAALLQRLYYKPTVFAVISTLCIASFILLFAQWWFIAPLVAIALYMIWPVYAFQRYDPYRDQKQADIWFSLPHQVRNDLTFALRQQWHDMHNETLNSKLAAILAEYQKVYATAPKPNKTDDTMDRLDKEFIIASELVKLRKGII